MTRTAALMTLAALPGDAMSSAARLSLAALLASADAAGMVSSLDADALALLGLTGPTTPDRLAARARPFADATPDGGAWVDLPALRALANPAALGVLQAEIGPSLAAAAAAVRLAVAAAELPARARACPPPMPDDAAERSATMPIQPLALALALSAPDAPSMVWRRPGDDR